MSSVKFIIGSSADRVHDLEYAWAPFIGPCLGGTRAIFEGWSFWDSAK